MSFTEIGSNLNVYDAQLKFKDRFGNKDDAVAAVEDLVTASGFAVEKNGGLDAARPARALGMLKVRFGYDLGRGTAIALAWDTL